MEKKLIQALEQQAATSEGGEQLAKFPFPKIDAAFLASAMRGLMAMLILASQYG